MNLSLPCTPDSQSKGMCHGIPLCGFCYDMGLHTRNVSTLYENYNLFVIGVILPIIGTFGLIGNTLSIFIFSRQEMRSSINTYLIALACSDVTIIMSAFFMFFLESMRKRSAFVSRIYANCAPVAFPLGLTAQSMSVFITLVAAVDCYISVTGSPRIKGRFCSIQMAYCIIACCLFTAVMFNFPHWFEIEVLRCYSIPYKEEAFDVCPTMLRLNDEYLTLYYAWLYSIVMAIGPLLILIALNVAIVVNIKFSNGNESGDTMTLVLVVCLFIICNILPLTVNFIELWLNQVNTYMIDISNVMVVLNSSCNVLIYFNFGTEFRNVLSQEHSKLRHLLFKHRRNIKFAHELIAISRLDVDGSPRADDALLNRTDAYSLKTTTSCTDDLN